MPRKPPARRPRPSAETSYREQQPGWIAPMLATLVDPRPLPEGWIYEPKLDGVRCLAFVHEDGVRLVSRNRITLTARYPAIAKELFTRARGRAVLDGEIVAVDPRSGTPSFSLLQQSAQLASAPHSGRSAARIEYWVFDCLWWEGLDLRRRTLAQRRQLLSDALRFGGPIVLTPAWSEGFESRYRRMCARGGEGLVGKRLDSPYVAGRSADWVKLKCTTRQEFVVGGWTDPKGSREALGDRGKLVYAGKVGTGLDRDMLAALWAELLGRARASSPFAAGDPPDVGVHWVDPSLVVEVAFSEWTHDGRLRHPRFLGLRSDKPARSVHRESYA
jgi:bifunctional non-homologous end joining protein LigD